MASFSFQDKITIVTGASSGIGRAVALELARQGAHLALASRNTPALEQLAQQIHSMGGEVLVVSTDVAQQSQVEAMVAQTLARWGRLDILVSNAGQYVRSPIAKMTLQTLNHSMAVNFYGGVYAVMAVLPHMLAQRSGRIVLVSSMAAKTPLTPDAPYVAAKSALSGFGDVLRQELYHTGITVTLVCPGRVDSPMIEHLDVHWMSAKISSEKVARAIVRGIRRGKAEVILPPQTMLLYLFRFLSPPLMDFAARLFHLEGWEKRT